MSSPVNIRAYGSSEPSADELAALSKLPTRMIDVQGISAEVPVSLVACFDHLLNDGIVEGIFRVSGSVRKIKEVKGDYSNLDSWLESPRSKPLPRDVSGVLKRYTRDYFHAIGGLFTPSVLASLYKLYISHVSNVPSPKVKRSTSFSSELPSVSETDMDHTPVSEPSVLINSTSELLASKNPSFKNALFIYYLKMLSLLTAHEETTKMSSTNFSILFQQHIFETSNLSELSAYQGLLSFLIDNFSALATKYAADHEFYGLVGESDNESDSDSTESAESPISSPLTECFSNNQCTVESRRRSSISNRLSSLWESYNTPARSSKRFSLFSRNSDKLPTENRPVSPHEPMPSYEEMVNRAALPTNVEQVITKSSNLDAYSSFLGPSTISPNTKLASSPSLQSISEHGPIAQSPASKLSIPTDNYFENVPGAQSPSDTPEAKKVRPALGNLAPQNPHGSSSSVADSDANISPNLAAVSPLTPPASSPILPQNAQTIGEPELASAKNKAPTETKPSFGRRLSMRLRKKISS